MPNSINQVVISGRCGAAPVSIAGGTGMTFSIAVSRSFRRDGEKEFTEETSWVDCVAWNGTANLARKLAKGSSLTASGRLQQQKWTADDGSNRSKLVLVVNQLVGEFVFAKVDDSPEPTPDVQLVTEEVAA